MAIAAKQGQTGHAFVRILFLVFVFPSIEVGSTCYEATCIADINSVKCYEYILLSLLGHSTWSHLYSDEISMYAFTFYPNRSINGITFRWNWHTLPSTDNIFDVLFLKYSRFRFCETNLTHFLYPTFSLYIFKTSIAKVVFRRPVRSLERRF